MTVKNEQMDLCTNCLNISNCFYYEAKKEPVHFCEEFNCKDHATSLQEIERYKRSKKMFLPIW